jgi:hypothetical protein
MLSYHLQLVPIIGSSNKGMFRINNVQLYIWLTYLAEQNDPS